MRKKDTYKKCLLILDELKQSQPSVSLGKHLETIREECGDLWGISDEILHESLQQYQSGTPMNNEILQQYNFLIFLF